MGVRSRAASRSVVAILATTLVLVCLATLDGCAPVASGPELEVVPVAVSSKEIPPAVRTEIGRLLTENDLHASDVEAFTWNEVLDTSKLGVPQYVDASKPLGLDLAAHMGQSATWYTVGLRERSASELGTATASFVVIDGQVVGAGLHVWNSYPGVFALNDRSQLATSLPQ